MGTERWGTALLGAWVCGLCACDPQATPTYSGQVLLAISGSVQVESTRDRGPLIPALAFYHDPTATFHIVDVDVEGAFPSDFTMRVYSPPPVAAITDRPGLPGAAFGYLTAVTPDHPATLRNIWHLTSRQCEGPVDGPSPGQQRFEPTDCAGEDLWCLANGEGCYRENFTCPDFDGPPSDCSLVGSSGDPGLRQDPWATFAGLSETHVVMFLTEPLSSGHPIADALGVDSLGPGYHLFEVPPPSAEGDAAFDVCDREAEVLAVMRFNAAHKTDYSAGAVFGSSECSTGVPTDDAGSETASNPCEMRPSDAEEQEIFDLYAEATGELFCGLLAQPPTLVADPESAGISVRIGEVDGAPF